MSSSITFYVVDILKVVKVCGANRVELIPELKQSEEELFAYADEDDDPSLLPLEESVSAILRGDYGNQACDYLLATQVLCSYFGKEVILDSLQEARGGYLEQLSFLSKALRTPIPIPFEVDKLGEQTLFIGRTEIPLLGESLQLNEANYPSGELYEAYCEFLDFVREVQDSKADVVGFCL